jgi:hypothetical protein
LRVERVPVDPVGPRREVGVPETSAVETRRLYRQGDSCKSGETIAAILGDSQTASVFTTTDNQLRWEYHENGGTPTIDRQSAVAVFNRLMLDIKVHAPKARRMDLYMQLGKALHSALEAGVARETFAPVRFRVRRLALQQARFEYVVFFLVSVAFVAGILAVVAFLLSPSLEQQIVKGGIAGVAGATISVLQRSGSLPIDAGAARHVIALLGGTRALLGAIFGSFLVMAAVGNLVVGVVNDNPYVILSLALVAGFSERLIPELLRKLEGSADAEAQARSQGSS